MNEIIESLKCAALVQRYVEDLKVFDKSIAIGTVCTLVDTLAAAYSIDTMQLWEEMHKQARQVYDEMGPVGGPVRGM